MPSPARSGEPALSAGLAAAGPGRAATGWAGFRYLVLADLYRLAGDASRKQLVRQLLLGESFKYNFWMRSCALAEQAGLLKLLCYPLCRLILRHYTYKLGISVPFRTRIGPGFYIGHFGGIVVSPDAVLGRNVNISQGVTIGQANRGPNQGSPTIGDNVYIGPGAKIVGAVRIGSNVAIGANCVVTKDVPDHAVVVGVPGRVISQQGAADYVVHTDYDRHLRPPG